MAHFYEHQLGNLWHSVVASLTADHLTAGQKAIRAIAFALVFLLMAIPLILDLFR